MPAVVAASIALATAAIFLELLHHRPLRAGMVGVGVGSSASVAATAIGYATNLLIDPILLALVVIGTLTVLGRTQPPVFGIVGVVASRFGVPFNTIGGASILLVAGGSGYAADLVAARRRRPLPLESSHPTI